ncbi:MAG: hypothetical protein FWG16_01425 [Micrococcales bacterium]|nr:hypothetical protein [Micrococcales bacterium]
MVKCLQEAGVLVELLVEGNDRGSLSLTGGPYFLSVDGSDGEMGMGGSTDQADYMRYQEKWNALIPSLQGETGGYESPFLFVGVTDHSQALIQCLDQTGYTRPEYQWDPVGEMEQKPAQAKASAKWAMCARENGFPGIKDPDPPKADDWLTFPSVELPSDITVEMLRALLETCPILTSEDCEAEEALAKAMKDPDTDWERPEHLSFPPLIEIPDNAGHREALQEVLDQAENACWD